MTVVSCLCLLTLCPPVLAAGDELRIHLISGSAEYESERSLRQLQRELEEKFEGILVTSSWGSDGGTHLDGIRALADADLAIIFARRMRLPEEQFSYIQAHLDAEKPVIGIRTASHAFQNYLEMDAEIFGGSYAGHGKDESVIAAPAKDAADHPILENVGSWTRPGKLYHNPKLGPDTTPLLFGTGQTSDLHQPLAWTNRYGKAGRAFYTSMGLPEDFGNHHFRNMLFNAIEWATARKLEVNLSPPGGHVP